MRLRRTALPLVLTAALVGATSSHAAVAPQVVDPAGDAIGLQGMHDILSVTYEVVGTTKKVGKKLVKTPKSLVITVRLAGDAAAAPGTFYAVGAVTDCGALDLTAAQSATSGGAYEARGSFFECGPPQDIAGVTLTTFSVSPVVTLGPKSIAFTIPWKSLPKDIALGDEWYELSAYTTLNDPLIGFDSQSFTSIFGVDTVLDLAKGDKAKLV